MRTAVDDLLVPVRAQLVQAHAKHFRRPCSYLRQFRPCHASASIVIMFPSPSAARAAAPSASLRSACELVDLLLCRGRTSRTFALQEQQTHRSTSPQPQILVDDETCEGPVNRFSPLLASAGVGPRLVEHKAQL
jgi:hypothetical protein